MPHDKSLTTFMPAQLVETIDEIAAKRDRYLADVHEDALLQFIGRWDAGKTSRVYFGRHPFSIHKSVWVTTEVRAELNRIRDIEGVGLSTIVQQALYEYCRKRGYKLQMYLPADYKFSDKEET